MVTTLRQFRTFITAIIGVIFAGTSLIGYAATGHAASDDIVKENVEDNDFVPLFDGHSLEGWEGPESVFRVEDGVIVGGTLESRILRREYLCTTRKYDDFELRLSAKVEGDQNSGIHFRSHRLPGSHEVGGYQADVGFAPGRIIMMLSDVTDIDKKRPYPLWGTLFDQFRVGPGVERYHSTRNHSKRNPFWLLDVADRDIVDKAYLGKDAWNQLTITAVGPSIEIRLNGILTSEYVEKLDIVQDGLICLQSHDGPPSKVSFRDIEIRELKGH